jgi:osmotically inducible protein OsmC
MPIRNSNAIWEGKLQNGQGKIRLGGGAYEGAYSFASRFEEGQGTNPEELIAAAHAGCFSMALAHELEQAGYSPESIETVCDVRIDKVKDGFAIKTSHLQTKAKVPSVDEQTLRKHAENAKQNCPVSKALAGLDIRLSIQLVS